MIPVEGAEIRIAVPRTRSLSDCLDRWSVHIQLFSRIVELMTMVAQLSQEIENQEVDKLVS